MIRNFGMSVALLVGLVVSATTNAMPMTWTLSDVRFLGGGNATGSFIFDADTGLYSNVNIITTNPDTSVRGNYGNVIAALADELMLDTIEPPPPLSPRDLLQLAFQSGLTNAGGTVLLDITPPPPRSFELTCTSNDCTTTSNTRLVNAGSVVAVPEPFTLSLLGLSLVIGLALGRRRA